MQSNVEEYFCYFQYLATFNSSVKVISIFGELWDTFLFHIYYGAQLLGQGFSEFSFSRFS